MKLKLILNRLLVCLIVVVSTTFPIFINTGCQTTQQVDPTTGMTNTVTSIDPQKLEIVKASVNTVASGVFTYEIKKSPDHSAEISAYVRAIGSTFCSAKASKQFSPATLFPALEAATQPLQANVSPLVIIGKNGLKAVYTALFNDRLTAQLKDNQWPAACVDIICTAIDQSLRDAGQPGVQ